MVAAASKGLGRAIADALAAEGCRLSISSRSMEARRDESVLAMACDVRKPHDIEQWFGETVAHFGRVDILVTNTGGPPAARFVDLTDNQWEDGIEGTLMNVVRLSRLA